MVCCHARKRRLPLWPGVGYYGGNNGQRRGNPQEVWGLSEFQSCWKTFLGMTPNLRDNSRAAYRERLLHRISHCSGGMHRPCPNRQLLPCPGTVDSPRRNPYWNRCTRLAGGGKQYYARQDVRSVVLSVPPGPVCRPWLYILHWLGASRSTTTSSWRACFRRCFPLLAVLPPPSFGVRAR